MGKDKHREFREKYRIETSGKSAEEIVKTAKKQFKKDRKMAYHKEYLYYACQIVSILGLELEKEYPNIKFSLFGRRKSKRSSKIKINGKIKELEEELKERKGEEEVIEIKPLYDYYGLKCIFDEIPDDVIQKFADNDEDIMRLNQTRLEMQEFIDELMSKNVTDMTYGEFNKMMQECKERLASMAYEESPEEVARNLNASDVITDRLKKENLEDKLIEEDDKEKARGEHIKVIQKLKAKKDDKVYLAVGTKIIREILENSEMLEKHRVELSNNPNRTKKKRLPNGYVADFYGLNAKDNIKCELQVQSRYRYNCGEHGSAAHNHMENGIKERKFYKRPKKRTITKKKYKRWEKKQFKTLPSYFTYKGQGRVHIYDSIDNFRRYNDCELPEVVEDFVSFITKNGKRFFKRNYTGYHEITVDPNKFRYNEEHGDEEH